MATYDPTQVSLVVGTNVLVGFAEGTFVKASRNNDGYMLKKSTDGRTTRVKNADHSGRFEFTLQNSSPSNDVLAALAQLDEDTGQGVVQCMVKDGSGTARALGAQSWVLKQGDLVRGKDLEDVTWIIETGDITILPGGTTQAPPTP